MQGTPEHDRKQAMQLFMEAASVILPAHREPLLCHLCLPWGTLIASLAFMRVHPGEQS